MPPLRTRSPRRRAAHSRVITAAEVFEQRTLLTQLVPIAGFPESSTDAFQSDLNSSTYVSVASDTGQISVRTLNHTTGVAGSSQILKGYGQFRVSADGNVIFTVQAKYSELGEYQGTDFFFYRRSTNGQFEEAGHQAFGTDHAISSMLPYVTESGAFVQVGTIYGSKDLWFIPLSSSEQPEVIVSPNPYEDGYQLVTAGSSHFLTRFGVPPQILNPDGTLGDEIGLPGDVPISIINGRWLVSRSGGPFLSLLSIDPTTGQESEVEAGPGESQFILISENGGPNGKAILMTSGPQSLQVFATDGTVAGTKDLQAVISSQPYSGYRESNGVYLARTQTAVVNWAGDEIWRFNFANGQVEQIINSNPYGHDFINGLVRRGDKAWFFALESSGLYGLYSTTGNGATHHTDFLEPFEVQVTGNTSSTWVLDDSDTSAVPGYTHELYRLGTELPDPAAGPASVSAQFVTDTSDRKIHVTWSPVPGAVEYQVEVTGWDESGSSTLGWQTLRAGTTVSGATSADFQLNDLRYYGWHSVHVRAISSSGAAGVWSSTKLAIAEDLPKPRYGQFLKRYSQLEFGFVGSEYRWQLLTVEVRNSADQSVVYSAPSYARFRIAFGGSPFPGSSDNYYYVLALPSLDDGDYTVTFRQRYIDPNPLTEDLSLPVREVSLPLSLRNGDIARYPETLHVDSARNPVQFSWSGSLQVSDEGFRLWVSDLTRGLARVIDEYVKGNFIDRFLPNGRYRAFIGLKDPATGKTVWSPATEFTVAATAPAFISPVAQSTIKHPVFHWSGNTKGTYEVWLTDQTTGKRVLSERVSGMASWSPATPLPAGRYAIWVRELVTGEVASGWSARHVFVQLEPALEITGGLNPGLDQRPVITWEKRTNAAYYEIWINKAGTPGAVYFLSRLTTTSHRLIQPIGNGTFTVWVRAVLKDGRSTAWGTGAAMTIGAAVVVTSNGNELSWTDVESATQYELWVNYEGGSQAKKARILQNANLKVTSLQLPTTLPKGLYRAWVRAIRVDGRNVYQGPWSAASEFVIT